MGRSQTTLTGRHDRRFDSYGGSIQSELAGGLLSTFQTRLAKKTSYLLRRKSLGKKARSKRRAMHRRQGGRKLERAPRPILKRKKRKKGSKSTTSRAWPTADIRLGHERRRWLWGG